MIFEFPGNLRTRYGGGVYLVHFLFVLLCPGFSTLFCQEPRKPDNTVSPNVLRIVGADAAVTSNIRLRLAENLTLLSPADQDRVFQYLLSPSGESSGLVRDIQSEYKIKNALMNFLRKSAVPVGIQLGCFREIVENPDMDSAIRDYAIQHMAGLLLRNDCPPSSRSAISEFLFNCAGLFPESTLPGTALFSLNQVYQLQNRNPEMFEGKPVIGNRLLQTCKALVQNNKSSPQNITSAIAVAGEVYPAESPQQFPDWITETFKINTTPEMAGKKPETAFIALAGARVLLDSGNIELQSLVRAAAQKLGKTSMTGRFLNQAIAGTGSQTVPIPRPEKLP